MGQMVFSQPELICFRNDMLKPRPLMGLNCKGTLRANLSATHQSGWGCSQTVAARGKMVPKTTLWPLPTVRGEGGLCCLPSHRLPPLNTCLVAFPISPVVALMARPAPGTPTLSTQAM